MWLERYNKSSDLEKILNSYILPFLPKENPTIIGVYKPDLVISIEDIPNSLSALNDWKFITIRASEELDIREDPKWLEICNRYSRDHGYHISARKPFITKVSKDEGIQILRKLYEVSRNREAKIQLYRDNIPKDTQIGAFVILVSDSKPRKMYIEIVYGIGKTPADITKGGEVSIGLEYPNGKVYIQKERVPSFMVYEVLKVANAVYVGIPPNFTPSTLEFSIHKGRTICFYFWECIRFYPKDMY